LAEVWAFFSPPSSEPASPKPDEEEDIVFNADGSGEKGGEEGARSEKSQPTYT